MLPDDLENLAQSAVATNLFSNNIIQSVTTSDYWNIANDFKPLMHYWNTIKGMVIAFRRRRLSQKLWIGIIKRLIMGRAVYRFTFLRNR